MCKKNHAKSRPNPVRRPFVYPGVSVMKDHTIFLTEKKKCSSFVQSKISFYSSYIKHWLTGIAIYHNSLKR